VCPFCNAQIANDNIQEVAANQIQPPGTTPSAGKCPNCGSEKTMPMHYVPSGCAGIILIIVSIFFCFVPLILYLCYMKWFAPTKRCLECAHKWRDFKEAAKSE
jgi:uncharacterized protein with PIN domain